MSEEGLFSAVIPYAGHLKQEAIRALTRLVGGTVAHPVIREVRDAENLLEGRAILNRGMAEAALERAKADPALVDRYLDRFLAEGMATQRNRESIAAMAAEELAQSASPTDADGGEPTAEWYHRFCSFAEAVTTEEMQRLWARVFAGEVRKPGSFSLKAMRVLAELEGWLAQDFTDALPRLIGRHYFFTPENWDQGDNHFRIENFIRAGLVAYRGGAVVKTRDPLGRLYLCGREQVLILEDFDVVGDGLLLAAAWLSNVGEELLDLVELPSETEILKEVIFAPGNRFKITGSEPKAAIFRITGYVDDEVPLFDEDDPIWITGIEIKSDENER